MFGFHTPAKKEKQEAIHRKSLDDGAGSSGSGDTTSVRKSIGEWEAGKAEPRAIQSSPISPPRSIKPLDRVAEAKTCVTKAKLNLSRSGNLKREIKTEVYSAVDRLYQLVKEAESIKKSSNQTKKQEEVEEPKEGAENISRLEGKIEKHTELLYEYSKKIEEIKNIIEKKQCSAGDAVNRAFGQVKEIQQITEDTRVRVSSIDERQQKIEALCERMERKTYASVTAATARVQIPEQTALHSVVVTATDEEETGEEVLSRIRTAMNAKEGGVQVEKIRKAKDRKVIVGCRTETERDKVKERLTKAIGLNVEDVKNKDPMVMLKNVLQLNTDDDVLKALRNQNKTLFQGVNQVDDRVSIAFKRRTRNPHTSHIVLRVSPILWQRMTQAEAAHIDLQRVRIEDQSPLVQCSLCLGYGHGRRFCKETLEKCSHCGGPHLKAKCADWIAGEPPLCCNCAHAKLDNTGHNAFSDECPIRKKWDALARATVAYC